MIPLLSAYKHIKIENFSTLKDKYCCMEIFEIYTIIHLALCDYLFLFYIFHGKLFHVYTLKIKGEF